MSPLCLYVTQDRVTLHSQFTSIRSYCLWLYHKLYSLVLHMLLYSYKSVLIVSFCSDFWTLSCNGISQLLKTWRPVLTYNFLWTSIQFTSLSHSLPLSLSLSLSPFPARGFHDIWIPFYPVPVKLLWTKLYPMTCHLLASVSLRVKWY